MSLEFTSFDVVDCRIEAGKSKAFGRILVRHYEVDDASFVEDTRVHVSCTYFDREPKWKTKRRLENAAKEKMLLLESLYPEPVTNIFVT